MRFTKMHGAGNDYVYIDARSQVRDWPALSVAMSDRHKGVGADGIILALLSEDADMRMRMFNADGSESEMCGNGIRCLVGFALSRGIVPADNPVVVVETKAGERRVTPRWNDGRIVWASVEMGEPVFEASRIPVNAPGLDIVMDYPLQVDGHTFEISCVSMGNPHAVAFIDTPVNDVRLHELGPMVENHPMFPERVNFEIANVIDGGRLRVRVWERGSGLTEACGTGACAIGVIGRRKSLTGDKIHVALPGGDLVVEWPGDGGVTLEGPVIEVFEGEWPE